MGKKIMTVYIFATFISAMFACLVRVADHNLISYQADLHLPKKKLKMMKRFFAVLSCLPLLLVSGFRYDVGTDYFYTYAPMFEAIAEGKTFISLEIGYYFLNRIALFFSRDYLGIFIITSFLFCFFMYKAIYRESDNPPYSIVLLLITTCYFFSMNGIRQAIAMAMFFYSIKYLKSREFKKYILIILLAATIHLSALIFIPTYFICKLRIKPLLIYLTLGTVSILSAGLKMLIMRVAGFTKYAYYIDSDYFSGKLDYSRVIVNVAVLVFLSLLYKRAKDEPNFTIFFNCQAIACLFAVLSCQVTIISRFADSFQFLSVLYLPLMASAKYIRAGQNRLIINVLIIALFFTYMFIATVIKGFSEVLPYQTILDR
jgi:hypothetical protein